MAHYHLGELFAKGAEGVPQDYREAYFRLCVAVSGKGLDSMQKYAIGERDEVANHLTPEARSQAQERAEQWITAHPAKP
jgi:TPR repeat protein